jgi:hypothetical protein
MPRKPKAAKASAPADPIIKMRSYQQAVFRYKLRRLFLLWSRQRGKSYFLSSQSLDWMMAAAGDLVTFISASIVLGEEVLLKEAQVWAKMLDVMRAVASAADLKLESSVDGLDFDAVCDLFEHSKLETRLWHTNTICSRSRVIAPNPGTAVGWTGHIVGDEVGRWPNAKDVMEAIEPFMAANPRYRLLYATTPPPDDAHYTYELFSPPEKAEFPVNPRGNFYRSKSGILCHRVDVWDGTAAGVPLYHPDTGVPITPEEHRRLAFDKSAWDRNYGLKFLPGGSAAVSLADLTRAMELGSGLCLGVNVTEAVEP